MTLHLGAQDGPEVECYLSTPDVPTNPDLVPPGCWCLIPKEHLKKGATYWVVATRVLSGEQLVWSFQT